MIFGRIKMWCVHNQSDLWLKTKGLVTCLLLVHDQLESKLELKILVWVKALKLLKYIPHGANIWQHRDRDITGVNTTFTSNSVLLPTSRIWMWTLIRGRKRDHLTSTCLAQNQKSRLDYQNLDDFASFMVGNLSHGYIQLDCLSEVYIRSFLFH